MFAGCLSPILLLHLSPLSLKVCAVGGRREDILGGLTRPLSFEAAPFAAVALVRLDMSLSSSSLWWSIILFTARGVSSEFGGRSL